jgi:hypothetical protein
MLLIKVPFLFLLKVKLYYSFDPTISHHFPPWFGFISRLGGGLSHFSSIRVGTQAHQLAVNVKADKESYPVRGKAQVTIQVKLPNGQPAANAEVALAGLLKSTIAVGATYSLPSYQKLVHHSRGAL